MKPYFQDESVTIYHGDCRTLLHEMPKVDLVLTDPPYGVRMLRGDSKIRERIQGDDVPPDIRWVSQFPAIIWGGNNFCDQLPRSTGWLVWDKWFPECAEFSQAELAWTNVVRTIRLHQQSFKGFMRRDDGHYHPTQKPLALMRWCLNFAKDARTVIDPFMGSGTTLRAAKDMGIKAIGIELEERYCEIAARRMAQQTLPFDPLPFDAAKKRPSLFHVEREIANDDGELGEICKTTQDRMTPL